MNQGHTNSSQACEAHIAALEDKLLALDEAMYLAEDHKQYLRNLDERERLQQDLTTARALLRKHQQQNN